LYLKTAFYDLIGHVLPRGTDSSESGPGEVLSRGGGLFAAREFFANTEEDLLGEMIMEVKNRVMSNPEIPVNRKYKEIITKLQEDGVFSLKNSVARVAGVLNINKSTVYMHIGSSKPENTGLGPGRG
jgi:hypothetical protein